MKSPFFFFSEGTSHLLINFAQSNQSYLLLYKNAIPVYLISNKKDKDIIKHDSIDHLDEEAALLLCLPDSSSPSTTP